MCGVFGSIVVQPGAKINLGIMNALAWANRDRGTDSLGFFDSSGKMTKRAGDPSDVLLNRKVQGWLSNSAKESWFMAGHTRYATRGKVNRRNSHPFRYGRIIGSHNGMVDAPMKFKVDSEFLFWALNKARGDYNKALAEIGGYWGLSWSDGEHFYLMCHNGELAVVEIDGVVYYSSSWKHLDSCTCGDSRTLKDGEVIRFSKDGTVVSSLDGNPEVPAFETKSTYRWGLYNYSGRYTGSTSANHVRNYASGGRGNSGRKASSSWVEDQEIADACNVSGSAARDYDAEWADAWAAYCEQDGGSIHSMSDDEFERYAG